MSAEQKERGPNSTPLVIQLTNGAVERIKCPPGRRYVNVWDAGLKGFGVRVNAEGTLRTYFLLYRVHGSRQERQVKIGRHNDPYRVDQARAKAMQLKAEMLNGVDPVLRAREKRAATAAGVVRTRAESITLREVLADYVKNHRTRHGELRAATVEDMTRHLDSNLADWADEPVVNITRDACIERFDDISERSDSQAALCFAYLRALLNHARDMFEDGDGRYKILEVNPVQRMFRKRKPKPEVPRTTRIPLHRVRAVWSALRKARAEPDATTDDHTRHDFVSFVLLTGCRLTEAASLRWSDVDFEASTITLGEDVTKTHAELVLPMSKQMKALLKNRHAEQSNSPFVFPSNVTKTGYLDRVPGTMRFVSEVAGTPVTLHDLRRGLTDVCAEVGIRPDRERMLLNHRALDVHAAHYSNSQRALTEDVQKIADWIAAAPV